MSKTTATATKTTIKPSQLTEAFAFCEKAKLVPFVLSSPGLGKSDIIRQYAATSERRFIDTRLGYSAPTDVKGFPVIDRDNQRMTFYSPAEYPYTPGNVWLLDEFSCAAKAVQNASLQLVLDRRVGDYIVPDNTLIVLAGNGAGDRVHVERLSSAVANRIMFLHLVPDLDDWTEWAVNNGVDVRVIAFLRFRPDLLHNFNPTTWTGEQGFATPRSWAAVARLTAENPPGYLRYPMFEGLVGPGPSAEFNAFLATYEQLPSIDGILLDPTGADVPEDPAARYAVCAALVHKTTKTNFDRVVTYLKRLPKEFEVLGVKLAFKTHKTEVSNTKAFVSWVAENREALL